MAWTPDAKVFDFRHIGQNLLDFVEANQQDALVWAGGPGLKVFEKFYTNASGRLQTIFPSLMILDQTTTTDLEDINEGDVALTFEATVTGGDADQLVADTKTYAMALESMLVNIPPASLMAGALITQRSYIVELATAFDITRGFGTGTTPTAFMQIFQTRVVYRLQASGY